MIHPKTEHPTHKPSNLHPMKRTVLFDFQVDKVSKQILVDRSFAAPADLVWAAWTEAEILDRWWAPKPYQNQTQSMRFEEGGQWHYAMIGPEGEKHYCLFNYEKIDPQVMYSGHDSFCDEQAVPNKDFPSMHWTNSFEAKGDETIVHIRIQLKDLSDLEKILEMGFKEGFGMGLGNLDEYIAAQFYLRADKKPGNETRVTTYLNFPGNTEEAMTFYRSVFRSEFVKGIQRFRDIPAGPDSPPVMPEIKDMVLHVELPIMQGKHILMATDAPKEMGFTLTSGNNMHINLEPETRTETERIFAELAEGGTITMPLQDMFFGAYYGSITDRYGINWMLHHQNKKA